MDLFTVPVEIANPQGGPAASIEPVVDTGAGFSVMPASLLERLGVEPVEQEEFMLASGEVRVYAVGEARFKIDGRERTTPVVFGDDGVFLLGAVTLQNFGLVADTTEHRLVPARLLLVSIQPGIIQGTPTH
ncbi:MAG: aspartyl protease family protein [Chloroflexota bacterium]|nr:aspartyl protease family protein [Chloroflexota bacterium]